MIPHFAQNDEVAAIKAVVSTEKMVTRSMENLSSDLEKAAKAFEIWGSFTEENDLEEVCCGSAKLFRLLSRYLAAFSRRETGAQAMVALLKGAEQNKKIKKLRSKVYAKEDSVQEKIQRMKAQSRPQEDLNMHLAERRELRELMQDMDERVDEDNKLFASMRKDLAVKSMSQKFGGWQHFANVAEIVGETGKLIFALIPFGGDNGNKEGVSMKQKVYQILTDANSRLEHVEFSVVPKPQSNNETNSTPATSSPPRTHSTILSQLVESSFENRATPNPAQDSRPQNVTNRLPQRSNTVMPTRVPALAPAHASVMSGDNTANLRRVASAVASAVARIPANATGASLPDIHPPAFLRRGPSIAQTPSIRVADSISPSMALRRIQSLSVRAPSASVGGPNGHYIPTAMPIWPSYNLPVNQNMVPKHASPPIRFSAAYDGSIELPEVAPLLPLQVASHSPPLNINDGSVGQSQIHSPRPIRAGMPECLIGPVGNDPGVNLP